MLWYRWNPTDPEVLVLLHKISSDPSQIYGRWENHSLPPLRYSVRRDLDVIAYWLWLSDHDVDPPGLLVEDTHVCTWAECRRWWDASCFIQYCSAGCRIRHEYDLWTRCTNSQVEYAVSRMWAAWRCFNLFALICFVFSCLKLVCSVVLYIICLWYCGDVSYIYLALSNFNYIYFGYQNLGMRKCWQEIWNSVQSNFSLIFNLERNH